MSESTSKPALPDGTLKGYSVVGRKLLTVTPTSATSDDSLIDNLLKTTFDSVDFQPGGSLEEFAEKVAEAAGLTVAKWEPGGE